MRLTAEHAWIFRITHIDNLEWDLIHGLQCRSSHLANPRFRNIGNLDLIEKRKDRIVPIKPWGTLSDYIPFYFTSRSPMLFNIKTGYNGIDRVPMEEIVIYAASLRRIAAASIDYVFTDRHAKLEMAGFSSNLDALERVDWQILQQSDFKHDPLDPGKKDRYQAEALIHRSLPCELLSAIACYHANQQSVIADAAARHDVEVPVLIKPGMFF